MMRSDLARFGRGFVYAWQGIWAALREERNFRFHLCASLYVFVAAGVVQLQRSEVAVLAMCVCGVVGMELMNSAVERAVHKPDNTHWWSAGAAKDMAAGAVLIMALAAACVGVCLFCTAERLALLWQAVTQTPVRIVLFVGSLVVCYLFVFRFGMLFGAKKAEGFNDVSKK